MPRSYSHKADKRGYFKVSYSYKEGLESYANRFYEANKAKLEAQINEARIKDGTDEMTSKEYFLNLVKEKKNIFELNKMDTSNKNIISSVLRQREFKSQEEYYNEQFIREFKQDAQYGLFKDLVRENGRFRSMNLEKAEYQGRVVMFGSRRYDVYKVTNYAGTFYILMEYDDYHSNAKKEFQIYDENTYENMATSPNSIMERMSLKSVGRPKKVK